MNFDKMENKKIIVRLIAITIFKFFINKATIFIELVLIEGKKLERNPENLEN